MKKLAKLIVLIIVVVFLTMLSLTLGVINISLSELSKLVMGSCSTMWDYILLDVVRFLRIPRFVLALLVGGGLAVTGATMQGVLRNNLADPYLLGISSGAGLGAVVGISSGQNVAFGLNCVGFYAFLGAMLATIIILLVSSLCNKRNLTAVILVGIAINALASAFISLIIALFANTEKIQSVVYWLMGSLLFADNDNNLYLLIVVLLGSGYLFANYRMLNLMLMDDEMTVTLGQDVSVYRRRFIVVATFMVAFIVYNSGIIGFVGLVVPHIVGLLFGNNYKLLLPWSFVLGALFLAWADLLSRSGIFGSEIPIGVMTALIGAPIFILLLINKGYGYGKS